MVLSVKLVPNQGEPYSGLGRYRRLVGNLNYLVIHSGITFAVNVVSPFINSPIVKNIKMQPQAAYNILRRLLEKASFIKIREILKL